MTMTIGVTSWFLPARGVGALEWASTAGFAAVHIDMTDLATSGSRDLGAASTQTGVSLEGLSVSTLETVGPHGEDARSAVDEALDAAFALGIGYVYLPSFGAAAISSPRDLQVTALLLRHASYRALETGTVVATENALTAPLLSTLFRLTDRDDVELLFDTQNLAIRRIPGQDVLRAHRARVRRCVHVKDGVDELGTSRLGSGTAEVARSLELLLSSGYDGALMIESDYRACSTAEVETDKAWLADLAADFARDRGSA